MTSRIGPYEIRGELGRGAMAVVWRGYDAKLGREVAIKEPVIPHGTDSAAAAELAARFAREGKAAAKLNHPGIVTIYASDIYDGRPAIVMELIDGETLADMLDRGSLEPASAIAVTDQLLDAVGYAHSRGVVHRDIKPDNIFITHDGRVKLADFGIAHLAGGAATCLTQAGTVMGTPGYMAPEQVTGQAVDARTDIFAIGAILHECLTGENPFGVTEGAAPTTVMYRIVHEAPAPQDVVGLHVPLLVAKIALNKPPSERFSSAEEMQAVLRGGQTQRQAADSQQSRAVDTPPATAVVSAMQTSGGANVASATSVTRVKPLRAVIVVMALLVAGVGFVLFSGSGNPGATSGAGGVAANTDLSPEGDIDQTEPHELSVEDFQELRTFAREYAYDQVPGLYDLRWWKQAARVEGLAALSMDGTDWATALLAPDDSFELDTPYMLLRREESGSWEVVAFGTAIDDSMAAVPTEIRAELDPPGSCPLVQDRMQAVSADEEQNMRAVALKFATAVVRQDVAGARAVSTRSLARVMDETGEFGWFGGIDSAQGVTVGDRYFRDDAVRADGVWVDARANSNGSYGLDIYLVRDAGEWLVEDWAESFWGE